jgi:hypothetical protein
MLKVNSGGQTGADRAALELAREHGFPTGGYAPHGFLTELGPDPSLATFGLVELGSKSYPERTYLNVRDSELTVWYGTLGSAGYKCTKNACLSYGRPFLVNPAPAALLAELRARSAKTLNVAGNRASRNSGIAAHVRELLTPVLTSLRSARESAQDFQRAESEDAG